MKNVESQNHIMDCESLTLREKKKSGIQFFTLQAFLENFSKIVQRNFYCH